MAHKPLKEKEYRKYLKMVGWELEKGHIDYKLRNEKGLFLCTIKIAHSKNGEKGVVADSVKKTMKEFKNRGWEWPPKKRLKNT
jgi:hypothetical protein